MDVPGRNDLLTPQEGDFRPRSAAPRRFEVQVCLLVSTQEDVVGSGLHEWKDDAPRLLRHGAGSRRCEDIARPVSLDVATEDEAGEFEL